MSATERLAVVLADRVEILRLGDPPLVERSLSIRPSRNDRARILSAPGGWLLADPGVRRLDALGTLAAFDTDEAVVDVAVSATGAVAATCEREMTADHDLRLWSADGQAWTASSGVECRQLAFAGDSLVCGGEEGLSVLGPGRTTTERVAEGGVFLLASPEPSSFVYAPYNVPVLRRLGLDGRLIGEARVPTTRGPAFSALLVAADILVVVQFQEFLVMDPALRILSRRPFTGRGPAACALSADGARLAVSFVVGGDTVVYDVHGPGSRLVRKGPGGPLAYPPTVLGLAFSG